MEIKAFRRIFLIPILILIYGFWQFWRLGGTPTGHNSSAALRAGLSVFAGLCSVGSILICLLAMAICYLSVVASRTSQNKLIATFTLCRGIIPIFMLLIMICNGLGIVSLVGGELAWLVSLTHSGHGSGKVFVMALFAIGAILWMLLKSMFSIRRCFAFFKREESHIHGHVVSEEQSPQLWGWVRDLAQKSQVVMPDNIVVGFFDCFYVTANNVRLNSGDLLTGNTLYLPLTYSSLMDKDEVAAVIGHELGHFTGQDTQYSLRFAPVYAGLENTLQQMANNSNGVAWIDRVVLYPALDMGLWFLIKFHETVSYWSRIREFAADQTGARASSPQALSSALLRISALSEMVGNYLNTVMSGKQQAQQEWISGLLGEARKTNTFDVQACLEHEIQHPTDSHPVTRARIEALDVKIDDNLIAHATRQVSESDFASLGALFGGLEEVRVSMSQSLTKEAVQYNEEHQQMLESHAALATESCEIWRDNKKKVLLQSAGAALLMVIGIVALFMPSATRTSGALIGMAWVLGFVTFRLHRSGQKPLYTFTPTHIECSDLDKPIEWTAITDFDVEERHEALRIVLSWREGYQPPKKLKRMVRGVENRGVGKLFALIVYADMRKAQDGKKTEISAVSVIEEFQQYLRSAHARQELKERR